MPQNFAPDIFNAGNFHCRDCFFTTFSDNTNISNWTPTVGQYFEKKWNDKSKYDNL